MEAPPLNGRNSPPEICPHLLKKISPTLTNSRPYLENFDNSRLVYPKNNMVQVVQDIFVGKVLASSSSARINLVQIETSDHAVVYHEIHSRFDVSECYFYRGK